jgi:putative PIN family toxin of toxin-antitoxin system
VSFCPRVVIDTNIVISTLIFGGRLSSLRLTWQDERFVPLVSRVTTTELIRVLAYPKFRLTAIEQEDLLADYLLFCDVVTMPKVLPEVLDCRDPFDVPFLVLAIAGRADYLVTGDRDLLSLKGEFSCPILTADEFLAIIQAQ